MNSARCYLDHAATTPMLSEARDVVTAAMRCWANPSSPHAEGRRARAALEDGRARLADCLDWPGEVIFTSGASEAIAIAIIRANGGQRLISAVEHDAVRAVSGAALTVPVLRQGAIDPEHLRAALRRAGKRPVVAIQHVNSETGMIQPLDEIAATVADAGGMLIADCAQSAGRLALPNADMIALSAHKFGGPPGVGALLVRDFSLLDASGGQEAGYRRGTENLPGVLGMVAALEAQGPQSGGWRDWVIGAYALRRGLDARILAEHGFAVCGDSPRSPLVASYYMPGVSGEAQLMHFDALGIAVSTGSACASGSLKASHVMTALGLPESVSRNLIRVSFGRDTVAADVAAFGDAYCDLARTARRRIAS